MKNKLQQHIKHIKTMFYTLIGCKLKRKDSTNYIRHYEYQLRYIEDGFHKQLFDQIMTYIVAGRFKEKTFLMTDCVGTPPNGEHMFCNKLIRLKSTVNETYSTITGYDTFQVAINLFDRKCFENDIIFDVENENHINEILEIYGLLKNNSDYNKGVDIEKDFLHSGLFFIEKGKICYYIIKKDDNDKMFIRDKKYVENNSVFNDYLFLSFDITDAKYDNTNEIIEYCKNSIRKHYKLKEDTKHLDLKDRFSFIIFDDDNKIKNLPYLNNIDFVLSEIGCKYEDI